MLPKRVSEHTVPHALRVGRSLNGGLRIARNGGGSSTAMREANIKPTVHSRIPQMHPHPHAHTPNNHTAACAHTHARTRTRGAYARRVCASSSRVTYTHPRLGHHVDDVTQVPSLLRVQHPRTQIGPPSSRNMLCSHNSGRHRISVRSNHRPAQGGRAHPMPGVSASKGTHACARRRTVLVSFMMIVSPPSAPLAPPPTSPAP